ncbi:hypothetical protein [Wolbachia endosymbiont of Pentidionis agamae]|uniref:hypothetical protein n=1 Tax=Wolbachia endosymbiont of Pentidionis agamae TaxID=3110435 RepID=UPI002FD67540
MASSEKVKIDTIDPTLEQKYNGLLSNKNIQPRVQVINDKIETSGPGSLCTDTITL